MGLLLYPETQKKAYAEIDRVIGNSRLPEFGDIGSLPYVTALVKEALRWRPAAPLGVFIDCVCYRRLMSFIYQLFPTGW